MAARGIAVRRRTGLWLTDVAGGGVGCSITGGCQGRLSPHAPRVRRSRLDHGRGLVGWRLTSQRSPGPRRRDPPVRYVSGFRAARRSGRGSRLAGRTAALRQRRDAAREVRRCLVGVRFGPSGRDRGQLEQVAIAVVFFTGVRFPAGRPAVVKGGATGLGSHDRDADEDTATVTVRGDRRAYGVGSGSRDSRSMRRLLRRSPVTRARSASPKRGRSAAPTGHITALNGPAASRSLRARSRNASSAAARELVRSRCVARMVSLTVQARDETLPAARSARSRDGGCGSYRSGSRRRCMRRPHRPGLAHVNTLMTAPPAHYAWSLANYPALAKVAEPSRHSSNGATLVGRFFRGRSAATIVLSHGYWGDEDEMLRSQHLHAAGFTVVTYNERGRDGARQGTWGASRQGLEVGDRRGGSPPGRRPNEIAELDSIGADTLSRPRCRASRPSSPTQLAELSGYMQSHLSDVILHPRRCSIRSLRFSSCGREPT